MPPLGGGQQLVRRPAALREQSDPVRGRKATDEIGPNVPQQQASGFRQLRLGAVQCALGPRHPGGSPPAGIQTLGHGRFEFEEAIPGAPISTVEIKNWIFLEPPAGLSLPRLGFLDPAPRQDDGPSPFPRESQRLFESQSPGCLLLAPCGNGAQRQQSQ